MNKQELAARIWKTADDMRSKASIEANDYKDYILGFIFYKFLSKKELEGLLADGWEKDDLKEYLVETNEDLYKTCRDRYGYFIAYNDLFSTWLEKGSDFDVSDVSTALSAFKRNINENHKKVFENIFDALETGLSKLGENTGARTKAISSLINLINPIPMDDKQGYDVLGYIYEYLISNFAANAGKKAGEFYTPHEVSLVMSQIVANHLKDRDTIQIYDPTSGSGSLLINIGQCVSKYLQDKNKIKYFAQEKNPKTYSLTRMNLVMRGIKPDNIVARCGDTLAEDWPYFDEVDKENTYEALYVDAVVSNPPYSLKWKSHDDARFSNYGIAPKSKADYAFLLHDLYHLKDDGIMTIVLPHGVLFRGGDEGEIRKNLIENDNIDAIIGLPANIFFGTGIPTIIMVLKKKRDNSDVLTIDASKCFVKEGKNNKLRACDIKKIVDTYINRISIDKYSRVVSKEEIRNNDYNLNIPRYVDSSEKAESYDICSTMLGGIPNSEINELHDYWNAFPSLKGELFTPIKDNYSKLAVEDIKETIAKNKDVETFENSYKDKFSDFGSYLEGLLIDQCSALNVSQAEEIISNEIFNRLSDTSLVDKYTAYELLAEAWKTISTDLETIQTEGLSSLNKVDPVMVTKKKDNKEYEAQEGWKGHLIPFELVQSQFLSDDVKTLVVDENRMSEITSEYEELMDALTEDDKQNLLDDENASFVAKEVANAYKEVLADISTPETEVLEQYLALSKTKKLSFANEHTEIAWENMSKNKDGTYGKAEINKYIATLKSQVSLAEGTYEYIVNRANALIAEEKELKKIVKDKEAELHLKTKDIIETMSKEQSLALLSKKWISPLLEKINDLPKSIIDSLTKAANNLAKKYETTLIDIDHDIKNTEKDLISMLEDLDANQDDTLGLKELMKLLGGE